MMRRRFSENRDGRVPFALVAVFLLVSSMALAAIVSRLDRGGTTRPAGEEGMVIADLELGIAHRAADIGASVLENGLVKGLGPEAMSQGLMDGFCEGFAEDIGDALNATGHDGWEVGLEGSDLGIDLGAMPDGRVVGPVAWTARSPDGAIMGGVTKVSEDLGRPLALAYSIRDRLGSSGNEGGELGRLFEAALYKLAAVRSAGGELRANRVLTRYDIGVALELVLGLLMNSSSAKGTQDGADAPGDLLLEALNITTVRGSAVLAQYILGLMDYYLLWFRDYTGIGETAESFFRWVGEATDGDKDLDDAKDRWYTDLKVRYLVERWAFDVMSAMLHVVLEMSGDEDIDVRTLGLDDLSSAVEDGVNATAANMGAAAGATGPLAGLPASQPPEELVLVLGQMPCKDPAERDEVFASLRTGLAGTALQGLDGLLELGRGLADRAWDEVAATGKVRGFSDDGPGALLAPAKAEGNGSRLKVTHVDLRWSELAYDLEIEVRGTHYTAPEARLHRALTAAMGPDKGLLFSEVRPYETDYRIRIRGGLVVHDMVLSSVDRLTSVGGQDGLALELVVPINLSVTIPVLTGLPLAGVDYDPSDTLAGDLSEALWEFVNRTWAGLSWAAGAMFGIFHGLEDGLKELGRRGLENLGSMTAASFSRVVEGVLRALYERAWNEAVNQTWRFLRKLLGDDLREMLTFNATVAGLRVMVQLDLFAECINISYSTDDVWFNLTFKRLAEDVPPFRPIPVEGFRYALLGVGELRRGGLFVRVGLDPLTVVQPSVVQVLAERRDAVGKGYRFELAAPVAERAYKKLQVSLSSVIGSPLKGIPIPGTGMTFDIDAGIRISYGADIRAPDKLLIKAVRAAWYKTLEGYNVRSLYDDIGDPVLLEAFIMNLLNNIANSIEDVASSELPEVEVFVEGKASAALGAGTAGFGLSFVIKEPVKVLWDVIPWLGDSLKAFLLRMAHPGMPVVQTRAPSMVMERLYVRGTVYTSAGLPDFLGGGTARVELGARLEANLPALGAAIGKDLGRWMVRAGVVLPDLPSSIADLIPGFDAPGTRCDLWPVQLAISELDNDRAKLSEVYYDTKGYDPRQEFVEIWNPTGARIDLSRWVLADRGGDWRLPDHLDLGPGARMVIARNRDGFRAEFGTLPEVSGLTLSLDNEGDGLVLYDPWGVRIDEVGWKNGVHGWGLKCRTGESLHRGPLDTDTPWDWHCAAPDPGR